jgi:hypothetical protein
MPDQKFIFIGQHGSIGPLPLEYGTPFDADPDFVRAQGFPAVPADMLHVGYTQIEAGMALVQFHAAPPRGPRSSFVSNKPIVT